MKYFFLGILFFGQFLLAIDITSDKQPIYKEIDVAWNIQTISEVLQYPEAFTSKQYFIPFLRKQKNNDNLWLRLPIKNSSSEHIERQLIVRWINAQIDYYVVHNESIKTNELLSHLGDFQYSKNILSLAPNETAILYLHIKVPSTKLDDFFYIYLVKPNEFNTFILTQEKLFHNGFFLGAIVMMMLYNFFMFLSLRDKSYFYLMLYQLSIIFFSSQLRTFMIDFLSNVFSLDVAYWCIKIGAVIAVNILYLIFTKSFLNTKKEIPLLNDILNVTIVVLLILCFNNPITNHTLLLTAIYLIIVFYAFLKRNSLALLYTFGFSALGMYTIFLNLTEFFKWNIYFNYMDSAQIIAFIDACILCIVMYLKIKKIVKQKEKATKEAFENERIVLERSRFAVMGEMIAAIAHQWRQPLNHLNMIMANLQLAQEQGKLNSYYLQKKAQEADNQLKYMSTTIEDFSNFFANKGKEESFNLKEVCEYAAVLIRSSCQKYEIKLIIESSDTYLHVNYKNELVQVILVILNNAIDALQSNNIENRTITIRSFCNEIHISDNGGGISDNALPMIFDPYFSTKDKKFGTGLGLYTAKTIMETLIKGQIFAENSNNGACFKLILPTS